MILLYAGRRPGTADFPDGNVAFVADQVAQLLAGLRPRAVIGSAAAGGDLLVLDAAARLDVPAHVVLAGDREAFLASSVSDKGDDWTRLYRARLPGADVHELERSDDAESSYRAVTHAIGEIGRELLQEQEELVVLAISRPRGGAGVDHTEELVVQHAAHHLVLRIDPTRAEAAAPRAFVAMPFGIKPYPDRGWRRFDADLSYHRIVVPALLDAGYRPMRADTDALLEVIDHTMLRELNRSEVVIADLAMLNANVMWELGLRHAWRRSGTVLIAPSWVKNPFDVARVPLQHYDRAAQTMTEQAQRAAIEQLQRALADVPERRIDSPVFANLSTLTDVELPAPPAGTDDRPPPGELLAELTRAKDLGRADELKALAAAIAANDSLSDTVRRSLCEQAGLALNALDEHDSARVVLAPLAEADPQFERRTLQEQYAHALIRSKEMSPERLQDAAARLRALVDRYGPTAEGLGLLGSAYKRRIEEAVFANTRPAPVDVEAAIAAYRDGFVAEPTDAYPGINACALLRLRGRHWGGGERDLAEAGELVGVVRFAVKRRPQAVDEDVWVMLTLAECELHAHLLTGDRAALDAAGRHYLRAAGRVAPGQRQSATRQLRLMRAAGDDPAVMDPLLGLFG